MPIDPQPICTPGIHIYPSSVASFVFREVSGHYGIIALPLNKLTGIDGATFFVTIFDSTRSPFYKDR